jgi:hypothetical protein
MKKLILLIAAFIFCMGLQAQVNTENRQGTISFVSSQHIYVKFKSTDSMSVGDTLYTVSSGALMPALTIINLSSTSCVCTRLSAVNFTVGNPIFAKIMVKRASPQESGIESGALVLPVTDTAGASSKYATSEKVLKQEIHGSIAAISYSDFSNTIADNSQRYRYTLSLDVRNIADSKFSAESYVSFRYKAGNWDEVKNDVFNALKIYSLAVRYDPNKTTQISLGRKINPRISNIGAMDGLQVEKSFGNFVVGGLVGFRPDYADYGFNFDLLQFGAFVSHKYSRNKAYVENSLAFMQQMNHSKTDRRFLYFQHANTLLKNLYFFSTFEVDLYELKQDSLNQDVPQSTFNLTGVFLSLRYRLTKKLTLSGSYDARKNVVYYETYKSYLDRILETETRQGFRVQASYSITSNMIFGLQMGYRFLHSDARPSRNFNGFLTYNRIPGLQVSATLSATYLETSIMDGKQLGMSLYRDFLKGKIQTSLGYRYARYQLPENPDDITQHIGEMGLSWQFLKRMSVSMNYEGTFEQQDTYNHLYAQIRMRF